MHLFVNYADARLDKNKPMFPDEFHPNVASFQIILPTGVRAFCIRPSFQESVPLQSTSKLIPLPGKSNSTRSFTLLSARFNDSDTILL